MGVERSEPLRVALLEPAGRGGIHHYTRALADALAGAGAAVTLFTARDHEFAARDAATPPRFAIAPLFARRRTSPRALIAALRAARPDLLHLQTGTHPLLHLALLWAAKRATGAPAIVTAHDLRPKNSGRFGDLAAGWLQRAADLLIVHGESLRAELLARRPRLAARTCVVPHGEYGSLVAPQDAVPPPARPTLLFFGYLHPEKGLEDLLEALPALLHAVPSTRLVIAGAAEQPVAPLQQRAAELRVADAIDWRIGYVAADAVAPLFAGATGVVLPYREASQSGVLFLAGAHARPLVATRVGALPEAIEHGRTGWLVPPRDPAALGKALSELLSDLLRAEKMGKEHALRCRTEGAWPAIAERTLALYARLPRRPPSRFAAGGAAGDGTLGDARGTPARA
ncbi:MAG: glycosyltransferase family 4 protein [Planctomycetes bacterium]|nr:glycosyltransferase family 4 protein [Planctomycetota bacterium]